MMSWLSCELKCGMGAGGVEDAKDFAKSAGSDAQGQAEKLGDKAKVSAVLLYCEQYRSEQYRSMV